MITLVIDNTNLLLLTICKLNCSIMKLINYVTN